MQLADRRELAWAEMGGPAGYPVFAFHGTPGSRREILVEPAAVHATGARVMAPDRQGCGASTRQRRRANRFFCRVVRRFPAANALLFGLASALGRRAPSGSCEH